MEIRNNTAYFLKLAAIYSICFTIAFYRNFASVMFPVITALTFAVCVLFLKKNRIPWKPSNWQYLGSGILLGISTMLTANKFVIFFNLVGIVLLAAVFMLRQIYDVSDWKFGQYICNIFFLYFNMIPELASPFIHFINLKKKGEKEQGRKTAKYVWIGILLGIPMVLAAVALLSSADQIFSKVIGNAFWNFFETSIFSPDVLLITGLLLLGFFGIYSFLSALSLNNMPKWEKKEKKQNPVIAVTFLSMVTAIYLIFCIMQALFLFTGGMLLPKGYTYAEYARQGFFQLLFVCIFNLILALSCLSLFEKNKILKVLLLVFSGCTYVMTASSAFRMLLYVKAYHLSFLRVLVLWFLALLAVFMIGVIRSILQEGFCLFRYGVAVVTAAYLLFSFGRPDALIASYNISRMGEEISLEDLEYLADLSADALPALSKCNFSREDCRRRFLNRKFHQALEDMEKMNVRTFHASKYRAGKAAEKYFAGENI